MMHILYKLIASLANFGKKNKLTVLTYHRVLNAPDYMYPTEVDVDKFTWQMELLKRYFNVLPLSDALTLLKVGKLPSRAVCLTFDDGYASCYTEALPILKRFGFTASFFIVSSALDQKAMWNDLVVESVRAISAEQLDLTHLGLGKHALSNRAEVANSIVEGVKYLPLAERDRVCNEIVSLSKAHIPTLMLNEEQVVSMHQQGMEIGGHTVSHPILKNLSLSDAKNDIFQNKCDLERILGTDIRYFAYPNGRLGDDYLPEHAQIVRECGYEAALTTDWGCIDSEANLWQLPRFTPWDNSRLRFIIRMVSEYFR